MMGALLACANLGDLERGRFVHKLPDKLKLDSNVSVMNSLISMYSKCKRVDIAASIFDNLKEKTNASHKPDFYRNHWTKLRNYYFIFPEMQKISTLNIQIHSGK